MYLIGDPHLGREFRAYVPLDRLGDREAMMMKDFERRINASDETTVIVGDLFDRPVVATQTLYATINLLIAAALARPNRKIIIMAGNHDLNKAIEVMGSFHILAVALERVPNIRVVFEPTIIDQVVYFPWQYERTALEQVDGFSSLPPVAVGHWDLASFGEHVDHLCPTSELREKGVTTIYSGHWHVAGQYDVSGFDVTCTGSMQPMTHAEDPEEKMYVTLSHAKYRETDPDSFRDKYVRVRAVKGEEVSPPPTCLGFKVDAQTSETEIERVNLGTFDMNDILIQAFKSFDLNKNTQTFIKENLNGIT